MRKAWIKIDSDDNEVGRIVFVQPNHWSSGWIEVLIQKAPEEATEEWLKGN